MPLRDLVGLGAHHRRSLAVLVMVTILNSLAMLAVPWLAGRMVGGVTSAPADTDTLVAALLAALVLIALLSGATQFLAATIAARLLADVRVRVYAHLQSLPVAFHDDHDLGDSSRT